MEVDQKTALKALFNLSVNTNLEFIKQKTKSGPLFYAMVLARRDAVEALKGLVKVDPVNVENVRKLQNEVQRFIDLVAFVTEIFREGDEAAKVLDEAEKDELRDVIAAEGGEIPGDDE